MFGCKPTRFIVHKTLLPRMFGKKPIFFKKALVFVMSDFTSPAKGYKRKSKKEDMY